MEKGLVVVKMGLLSTEKIGDDLLMIGGMEWVLVGVVVGVMVVVIVAVIDPYIVAGWN